MYNRRSRAGSHLQSNLLAFRLDIIERYRYIVRCLSFDFQIFAADAVRNITKIVRNLETDLHGRSRWFCWQSQDVRLESFARMSGGVCERFRAKAETCEAAMGGVAE
jgi:hypothetical protein